MFTPTGDNAPTGFPIADFAGGNSFSGFEDLPHVTATLANLRSDDGQTNPPAGYRCPDGLAERLKDEIDRRTRHLG